MDSKAATHAKTQEKVKTLVQKRDGLLREWSELAEEAHGSFEVGVAESRLKFFRT